MRTVHLPTAAPAWPRVALPPLDLRATVVDPEDASLLHAELRAARGASLTHEQAARQLALDEPTTQPMLFGLYVDSLEQDVLAAVIARVPVERWTLNDAQARLAVLRLGGRAMPFVDALVLAKKITGAALLEVVSPSAAIAMSRLMSLEARRWLIAHESLALASLAHASLTGPDDDRAFVASALRWLAKRDGGATLRAITSTWSHDARVAIEDVIDPVREVPMLFARPLPKSWKTRSVNDREGTPIDASSMQALGILLATPFPADHPHLRAAFEALDPESLASLGAATFEEWVEGGLATQNQWIAHAFVVTGGERAVRELGRRARAWARSKEGHVRRAARKACEVFAWLGSDACLEELASLAHTTKDADTRARAEQQLELVALERGVAIEELASPSFELDVTLSFGTRSFRPRWNATLGLALIDDRGGELDDLPKPTKKDDAALAKAAKARWKELRDAAADAVKSEAARLERLMIDETPISMRRFEDRVIGHEVSRRLAQGLVWAAHDTLGTHTFRIAEDGTLANVDDERVALTSDPHVTLVHPLRLDEGLRDRWRALFASYEILAPFPQLDRSVHTDPSALVGREIHPGRVLGLRHRGWTLHRIRSGDVDTLRRTYTSGALCVAITGFRPEQVAHAPPQRFLGPLEAIRGRASEVAWSEALRDLIG